MIVREKGEVGLECDECGDSFWSGCSDFKEMIEDAKEEGWRIKKDGEDWIHTCPDCSQ